MEIEKTLELRDRFIAFTQIDKEISKEIKKEAERESLSYKDIYFYEWFIFEKTFNDGENCLAIFSKSLESQYEKSILKDWEDFIFSIFKIKKEDTKNYVLLNMGNNQKYCLNKQSISKTLKVGEYVILRLLPVDKDLYISTNVIYELDIDANSHIYNIVAQFELDYPQSAFLDNKNKIESSYRIQAMEYEDFIEFFGNDEIIVKGNEISNKLQEFYHYRYFQKRDRETGKTIAKIFREKYGVHPELPVINLPEAVSSLEEVGIVYDPAEGLNLFPWYGIFSEVFRNKDFNDIPGYKECVMEYLKSDTISMLPFRKALKKYPENFVEVFKKILNRKRFNIPDDFNKVMEKYKISFINRNLEPAVIPMPEKAKALLRTKKPEEYGSINLYEGPNRYKDIRKKYKIKS